MKVLQGDAALAVQALHDHRGTQRGKRDVHVRRVRGDATLARADDRVDAVEAVSRRTARAGMALVACLERRVVEVVAAGALQQIAADGRHVAQLGRRAGQQCLGQQRVAVAHGAVVGQGGVAHHRADAQTAVGQGGDSRQWQPADVDQVTRRFNATLHQIEQVRAAADEGASRRLHGADGVGNRGGALVVEIDHAAPRRGWATLRTAATMLG